MPLQQRLEEKVWNRKVVAIAMAALMLLSIGVVLSATTASAASNVTVALKKPSDGATWQAGQDYRITWAYPNGGQSQITSVQVGDFSWSAFSDPGPPPTSCVYSVPTWDPDGWSDSMWITISVDWDIQPGVAGPQATDSHVVTIADNMAPAIYEYPSTPQQVVLGADATTYVVFGDDQTTIDEGSVKVTVDGKPAPSGAVTFAEYPDWHYMYELYMQTNWLSLGKHRVTLTVSDMAGNTARASWTVQVVQP